MNGASPFINAQPDRDIDSTPPARPTLSSSLRIACATWIAHVRDDAEAVDRDRGDRVWEAGGQCRPPCDVAHALVRPVHAARGDVLDTLYATRPSATAAAPTGEEG
jgi:hypothetical protein